MKKKDTGGTKTVTAECMACGHSGDAHDKIALRYCNATVATAVTRKCICPPAPLV